MCPDIAFKRNFAGKAAYSFGPGATALRFFTPGTRIVGLAEKMAASNSSTITSPEIYVPVRLCRPHACSDQA